MNPRQLKSMVLLLIISAVLISLAGCMTLNRPKPGETFTCTKPGNLTVVASDEAALEKLTCVVKKWKGADALHFNVTVRNVSVDEQRFKVNIFLDNGKAVGGLLPRKTKKGLVGPGQTISFEYPVKGVTCAPKKIDLIIKTMSK